MQLGAPVYTSRVRHRIRLAALTLALPLLWAGAAAAQGVDRIRAPEGAEVYFITPQDGATLASPVKVRFGLRRMGVAPAGVVHPNTGHHHLIVDSELPPLDLPIPSDATHLHFGGGQTEIGVELPPGEHTLQLLVGDHRHVPHEPAVVSPRIRITLK